EDAAPDATDYSAVALFVQAARRTRADFAPADEMRGIVRICRLVAGMPLAIELAAAWVRTLPCDAIADEIEQSLDILETRDRNVPERHRSLRATLDYSWRLLSADEQAAWL